MTPTGYECSEGGGFKQAFSDITKNTESGRTQLKETQKSRTKSMGMFPVTVA